MDPTAAVTLDFTAWLMAFDTTAATIMTSTTKNDERRES